MEQLNELLGGLRPADVLDILVVTAFVYVVLAWLRNRTSRRVTLVGLGLLGFFAVAQWLEMYLTVILLEALAIVLVLTGVIIFQADLRRMAGRLGAWSRRQPQPTGEGEGVVDELATIVGRLVEQRIGALVAIRGRERWPGEIAGGVSLEGWMSGPLLQSIFSPDSPGHDGAVLMEGNCVMSFGAQLPLSEWPESTGDGGGTRHAAALGLTERCDALVVVVSEERGMISVAEHGELTPVESPAALKDRLLAFWRTHQGKVRHRSWRGIWRNTATVVMALTVAVLAWAAVVGWRAEQVQRTFTVPIELRNLSDQWRVEGPVPSQARVTLAGSEQTFRMFNAEELMISLDASQLQPGRNRFVIHEGNLSLNSGLDLYDVDPAVVSIYARRAEEEPAEEEGEAAEGAGLLFGGLTGFAPMLPGGG